MACSLFLSEKAKGDLQVFHFYSEETEKGQRVTGLAQKRPKELKDGGGSQGPQGAPGPEQSFGVRAETAVGGIRWAS